MYVGVRLGYIIVSRVKFRRLPQGIGFRAKDVYSILAVSKM